MSKQMIIYWYTTINNFNEIQAGNTYCIGEVDPSANSYAGLSTRSAAEKRIKEELGKSVKDGAHIRYDQITDIECQLVDFPNPNNKIKSLDKDVHAVLKEIGCKQISTEWFNTKPDEIKRVLDYLENGTPLGTTYTLRGRQPDALARFKQACDNNEKRFGLFAMPRFGKTICSFEIMNYLFEKHPDKKYVFFISAKLDAEQALREDYYKFDKSCKFKLFIYGSNTKPSKEELLNNKWCFFASKQWFDGKTLQDIQHEFPIVNGDDCVAVFFDEAHFARMTERAQRTLSILNPYMQIDITGTPFRLKSNEDYNDNNSYVYSILDENSDYENAENKDLFRLKNPEMVYITPKNEFFSTDSTFSDFFDSDKATEQIQKWVKNSFYNNGFNIDNNKLDITNAIIVLPPRRKYCDLFYKAVREITEKEKLAIKCVRTSTKDDSNEDYDANTKKVFSDWNNTCKTDKNNFHLLITIGKGLQAVSFPDCHAIIMMCDMTSPEQYIQAAFRAKTPNDIKKEAYVIDYNKGRTLQIIDTFIKNHLTVLACDSHYKREYERALSTIQIRDHNLTRQNYTFEEIFQTFVTNWNIERITDSIDFDLDKLAQKIDLSKVNINDLMKPRQLSLQLSERGTNYEEEPTGTQSNDDGEVPNGGEKLPDDWKDKYIEELKRQLLMKGYIPFGGSESDRIHPQDINPDDIQIRELEVGAEREIRSVWSYMGGDGDLDDIYIDDSFENPSLIRWRYRINSKFVNIKGEGDHGQGDGNKKKLKAFINAIIRYLPAYFLVSGKVNTFEEFQARFGRQTVAEKFPERQLFRKFMDCGIDYRYVFEILKSCDIVAREQILSFVNNKVDKCYDKNGNLIPEQVLELLWIYKKDGSRPVPKQLADIMRNGKNYDIVVCGGYWLTDNTTKMYITDSFSESEIMKLLRPNCTIIYSNDILKTLDKEREQIMKFKSFIMNPPYSGDLHLRILKKIIDFMNKDDFIGVSLQPDFRKDYMADMKNSAYNNTKDFLSPYAHNITEMSREQALDYFKNIQINEGLIIGAWTKSAHPVSLNIINTNVDILKKTLKYQSLKDVVRKYTNDKYFVPITIMQPTWAKRKNNILETYGVLENGRTLDGVFYQEARFYNSNVKKDRALFGVPFNTLEQAKNFASYLELPAFCFCVSVSHTKSRYQLQFLPFPEQGVDAFNTKWTNERFYKYFDITSDEQKIIEKTVADAKK